MCDVGNITVYAYDILLQNGESSIIKYGNVSGETQVLQSVVTSTLLFCGYANVSATIRHHVITF